jgi:hypothetical protein
VVNIKFSKQEVSHLLFGVVILGIIFGFDDKSSVFVLSRWLLNLLVVMIITAISLLIVMYFYKLISSKMNASVEFRLWGIKRFSLNRDPEFPINIFGFKMNNFYLGPILGIFVSLVSKGKFIFAAVHQILIEPIHEKRAISNKFKELKTTEIVTIAIIGPLVNVLLAGIFLMIGWKEGFFINSMLAIYSLLPLPRMAGGHIFFNSPFSYIFFVLLIIPMLLLLEQFGLIISLILALVISTIITLTYFYYSNK